MQPQTFVGEAAPLKLDLGCGSRKREGYLGLDRIAFDGVDHVLDIGKDRWPFEDGSVSEVCSSHFMEHLTATERVHVCNEAYRVLEEGGKFELIVPHWSSVRAYGDPTHQWPPFTEFWSPYLSRKWRLENAPHTDIVHWPQGFNCHFEGTCGYSFNPSPETSGRSDKTREFWASHYVNVVWDLFMSFRKVL